MTTFGEHFLKRYQAGEVGILSWSPGIEDPSKRRLADAHLAHWLAYLDVNGFHQTAKSWRHAANSYEHADSISLPDCPPWVYDSAYNDGGRDPWRSHPREMWVQTRVGKLASEQTVEERRATVEDALVEVRKAARNMEMFPNEPRRQDQPAPPPAKTLADLKRELAENPVKMSPLLAAKLQEGM